MQMFRSVLLLFFTALLLLPATMPPTIEKHVKNRAVKDRLMEISLVHGDIGDART